jgi:hypothetical protein
MHAEYTPEEVRTLLAEDLPLEYASATDADVLEASDVLEGVEELVRKLDPAIRRDELLRSSLPVGERFWIPVVSNCTRAVGVAIDPEGATSFVVTGLEFSGEVPTYFCARQAARHALQRRADAWAESSTEVPSEDLPQELPAAGEDRILAALRANGNALAAGRTVADVDTEVLAALYPLSEAGIAHLFAEGEGVVLATAGSTEGDRRRAARGLAALPGRSYSSPTTSVLFECGEAGSHYSEEPWFGHTLKEATKPKEAELDDAAERFRASRFVRPSHDRPVDVAAVRRSIRDLVLVRAAVCAAVSTDADDAEGIYRAVVLVAAIARIFSRSMVRRALSAERPWDTEAERTRMEKAGARLRYEIVARRKSRGGRPAEPTPAATLDASEARRKRRAGAASFTADPGLRRSIERRRKSGRAAYDTARAVYVQRCPELAHKLLHLLRRDCDGVTNERDFVSRHVRLADGAADPEGAILAALRSLAEAGKVRRVRSRKTGEVFVAATEPLDETGYRRALNGLIRDESCGIVSPWSDTAAVRADGEADEWRSFASTEELEGGELERLAPRRLCDTASYERPLPAADLLAEPAAEEEIEAVAKGVA